MSFDNGKENKMQKVKVLGKSDEIHEMISTFEKIKNKESQNILRET